MLAGRYDGTALTIPVCIPLDGPKIATTAAASETAESIVAPHVDAATATAAEITDNANRAADRFLRQLHSVINAEFLPDADAFDTKYTKRGAPRNSKPKRGRVADWVGHIDEASGAFLRAGEAGDFVAKLWRLFDAAKRPYRALLTLLRKEAVDAHTLLLNVIAELGSPSDRSTDPVADGIVACEAFARILDPTIKLDESAVAAIRDSGRRDNYLQAAPGSAARACYVHDRRTNRPTLLYTAGDRFPEAMSGYVWAHNLPAQLLFPGSEFLVDAPFISNPDRPVGPEHAVGFGKREDINPNRVLAFRLLWGHSRMVFLIRWRNGHDETSDPAALREVWRDLDLAERNHRGVQLALRSLLPATRYFDGWLSEATLELSELYAPHDYTPPNPSELIKRVGEAATASDSAVAASNSIRYAVEQLLGAPLGDRSVSVHWTNATACQSDDGPAKGETFQPRQLLTFIPGKYGTGAKTTPQFPIRPRSEGGLLVAKSICAQSAYWRVTLLIRDMRRQLRDRDGTTTEWCDIIQERHGYNGQPSLTELAVPIDDLDPRGPLGVINVEQLAPLTSEDVRRTELVARLYERLWSFYNRAASLPAPCKTLVDKLVADHTTGDGRPQRASELLYVFCQWAREQLCADLAFIQIYDARVRVFRPLGTSAHEDLVRFFIKHELASAGFSDANHASRRVMEVYDKHLENNYGLRFIHQLVEHLIAGRTFPKRVGRTWNLFRDKDKESIERNMRDCVAAHRPSTRMYTQTRLQLRFCQSRGFYAHGVMFVSWKDTVTKNDAEIWRVVNESIRPVMEVVAAMYSLHRYCDPDSAASPVPEPSEKLIESAWKAPPAGVGAVPGNQIAASVKGRS